MITSTSNSQIKNLNALLKLSRERKKQGLFVAEGLRMCREIPEELLQRLYLSESFAGRDSFFREKYGEENCEIVKDSVFSAVSDTQTPQGVMALVKSRRPEPMELLSLSPADGEKPLFLVLENLQDPGNLGTILRTAEGAGVTGIFLSPGCVDLYSPKVCRSTMGSLFRVPVAFPEDFPGLLSAMKERGIRLYAAVLQESVPYDEPDYREASAFLIGNEGNGLTEETVRAAQGRIRIPMRGQVESLNASVAASLLMYEARRQRDR